MAKGGTSPTTQTTSVQLAPEQREMLDLAMPYAREFAANKLRLPDKSFVPGFTPEQTQGQEMVLGSAGQQQELVDSGANASKFFTSGDVLRPESNPALGATIDASVAPIYDNLLERVMPSIRSGAASTGNFGGSRQAIAEALAARDASRAAGETAAKVANQGYQSGLEAMTKGLGLLPQTAGLSTLPGSTVSAVGDVRQNLLRELMGEEAGRFNFAQLAPLLTAEKLVGLTGAIPGGSTTTNASTPRANPTMASLGGAASGAALGSMLFPGVGTVAGAGMGALLPWLMK